MTAVDETISSNSPTPAVVLGWVAAAGSRAWFPAEFAQQSNVSRDALDEPIHALRQAGLIRVQDWVKGLGQGYAVTPDGLAYVHEPQKLAKLLAAPPPPEPVADEPPTTFDRGEAARQALLSPRPPVVVQALIALNVLWFLVGLAIAVREGRSGNAYLATGDAGLAERLGAVSATDLVRGQWWRLATCAFVHLGSLHLVLNMFALASVGSYAESIWGRRKFILLYAASVVGCSCLGMVLQAFVATPEGRLTPPATGGASGAVWGLTSSLAAWVLFHREHLPPPVVATIFQRLGIFLAISVGMSFAPGVGWAGHLGGGLMGLAVACLFVASQRFGRVARWVALAATVLLTAACVAGLVVHTRRSEPWAALRAAVAGLQYLEYLKAAEPRVQPIRRPQVDPLYRQVLVSEAVRLDPKKQPELPVQVAKLRDDADALLEYVAKNPPPDADNDRLRAYALAVKDLAEAMRDALQRPDADLERLKELKKAVDQKQPALLPK